MSSPIEAGIESLVTSGWDVVVSGIDGVGGDLSTGISQLSTLTQEAVLILKEVELEGNVVLGTILDLVFAGLRRGVSLALAIIEAIAVRLFDLIPGFSTVEDALQAMGAVADVRGLAEALTGIAGAGMSDIETWAHDLAFDIGGVAGQIAGLIEDLAAGDINGVALRIATAAGDASNALNLIESIGEEIAVGAGSTVFRIDNALVNALNLFAHAPLKSLPFIPASHVVNSNPELLWAASFDNVDSVTANTGFSWDNVVGHTTVGSARAFPSGVKFTLVSNPIPVAQGEPLIISAWVQWSGLTTSGNSPLPVRLEAVEYLQGAEVSATVIGSLTSPPAASTWTQWPGTLTVPAGVDTVNLRWIVDTTATGGTVWFDDASIYKGGMLTAGNRLVDAFDNTLIALFGENAITEFLTTEIIPDIVLAMSSDMRVIVNGINNALGRVGLDYAAESVEEALGDIPATVINGATSWDQGLTASLAVAFNGITAFENSIKADLAPVTTGIQNVTNIAQNPIVSWVQNAAGVLRSIF